ncbi:MAG TPA: hypothetical protein VMG36_07660 [Thermoplasmata archaeon]|nr:hypothetical protein [Thermoplasmata archaeon]
MTLPSARRIVPVALGAAMLAVVVAAAFAPNTGVASAASNCTYGQCPSSSSSVPIWELATIGAVIVLAALVGLFLLMRRRRSPPSDGAAAMAGGPVPPAGASQPSAGPGDFPESPEPPAGSAAPSYVETPEDVGAPPPTLGAPPVAGAAAGGKPEAEPDIDSLMAELDKISGEILKRTPKKSTEPPADEGSDAAGDS